jgi:hypothetical protein
VIFTFFDINELLLLWMFNKSTDDSFKKFFGITVCLMVVMQQKLHLIIFIVALDL